MKYKIALMVIIWTGWLCFSHAIPAEGKTPGQKNEILVIGSARIIEENMARARDEALQDAMLQGVETYLISRLGGQGMINNFAVLNQDIIPRAAEQIENYHILSQERLDSTYKILLSLRINETLLEEKLEGLGILSPEGKQIKILFLVSESGTAGGEEKYWWKDPEVGLALSPVELALFRVFQEAGFQPVNRLAGTAEEIKDVGMLTPALTLDNAVRWGRLFSADVVIQGHFKFSSEKFIEVEVKAIHVDRGTLISQSNYLQMPQRGTKNVSTFDTIEQAVRKMTQKLGSVIIRSMDEPGSEITGIRIDLNGLHHLNQQKLFLDFIKTRVTGVRSIIPLRMKNSFVSFSVNYEGDVESLVRSLTSDPEFPLEADIKIRNDHEISILILS